MHGNKKGVLPAASLQITRLCVSIPDISKEKGTTMMYRSAFAFDRCIL